MNDNPNIFVIFGATGDLAKNKLIPAIYDLMINDFLPENFKIIAFSRRGLSDDDYREFVRKNTKIKSGDLLEQMLEKTHYIKGDLNNLESYDQLKIYLDDLDNTDNINYNHLFYLAVSPGFYGEIFHNIHKSKLIECANKIFHRDEKNENKPWRRLLVEKPFGTNQKEAEELDLILGNLFDENQIFRIDHYLAKETLQNILSFRFANAIFEPLWSGKYIKKIEIKLHEEGDIRDRGEFYNQIGALRDVGQNHVLQMLALITMEDPKSMKADLVRKSRNEILSKLTINHDKNSNNLIRAQYDGYKEEVNDIESKTETFFRVNLNIKNIKWKNVPISIESGKALKKQDIEIIITFKDKKSSVCRDMGNCHYNNKIRFKIQPENKISICFWVKKKGLNLDIVEKELAFDYSHSDDRMPDAYEKVFYDCIKGDQTLFPSTEEVKSEWKIISKILHTWKDSELKTYKKGEDPENIK